MSGDAALAAAAVNAKYVPLVDDFTLAAYQSRVRHRAQPGPIQHLRFIEGRQVRMRLPGAWPAGSHEARISAVIDDIRRSL